jgi:uncharacterized protein GlcG (DUF336 family)
MTNHYHCVVETPDANPPMIAKTRPFLAAAAAAALLAASPVRAADVIDVKRMSTELAGDIARAALVACREQGWQVTAVVVDRAAIPQAMLRDVHASRFTIQIAEEKANAVILSSVTSSAFRANRADIRQEMNHVDGILVLEGGVPIWAAGSLIGAVGVSGAPGGDNDEVCALKGVEAVQERLDFAD